MPERIAGEATINTGNCATADDHLLDSSSSTRKGKGISPKDLVRRLRLESLGFAPNNTVVVRGSPLKRRSSLQAIAKGTPPGPSGELGSSRSSEYSGKRSTPEVSSTRKTSVDSRLSLSPMAKDSPKRLHSRRSQWTRSTPDGGALDTIDESGADFAQPTILTVEKAAATKAYLETYFNELLNKPQARTIRRQYLESRLYYSPHLSIDQQEAIRKSYCYHETCYLRETRALKSRSLIRARGQDESPFLTKYESLKVLGKGSFGVVRLVREKPTLQDPLANRVYAMKVIRKSEMLRSSQEGHLRAERDFLVASEGSNWQVLGHFSFFSFPIVPQKLLANVLDRVVPLVASFQDLKSLYLVMEYMPGGDFLGLLMRESFLHETVARFYIAEMILAVEEAHRLKFIHRDIKPDNFLISSSGHLRISDFGLAFDGHWSHDASYYSYHRYSLLRKLGINVYGDEKDQQDNKTIQGHCKKTQLLTSELGRHDRQDVGRNQDLTSLLGWRNRCGNRTRANSVVGTSQYMAPEVIRQEYYDGRCDW